MINPIIAKQLKLCKVAVIPEYDDNATTLHINKVNDKVDITLQTDHYYVIELEDYLLNPSPNFTLHTNWNHGVVPVDKYMKCHVVRIMGKMVQIEGCGFDYENRLDLDTIWDGWLPVKSIKVWREI